MLPGCRVNASVSAGKPVEVCQEVARNGWGHVGNPQFGAAGLGQAHAQCSKFDGPKSFSFFFSLFSSLTKQRQPIRCPGSPPNGGISGLLVIGGSSPPPGYINDKSGK